MDNSAQSSMVVYNLYTMFASGFGDWAGTLSNGESISISPRRAIQFFLLLSPSM